MTHAKEHELTHLEHLYVTSGITKQQCARRLALREEKALEVATLADKLKRAFSKHITRV